MYASKPETLTPKISYPATLLRLAGALAFFDGLLYLTSLIGMHFLGPNLHALTTISRYLESYTANPSALEWIEAFLTGEVYLESRLKTGADVILAAHDAYVWTLWKWCICGFVVWIVVLLIVALILRHVRRSTENQAPDSPMGVQSGRIFVRCPFPMPQLRRFPLHPSYWEWCWALLTRQNGRHLPEWAQGMEPATPLARALLEHYLAYPTWPTEIPNYKTEGTAPTGAEPPGPPAAGTPTGHHGTATLGEHVRNVLQRALMLADQYNLPAWLVEQAVLAHDLGKLVTFRLEDHRWLTVLEHHDRMSGQLLAHMAEWQALPREDADDLRLAVRFHHALAENTAVQADTSPPDVPPRAWRLIELIDKAHKQSGWWGRSPSVDVPVAPAPPVLASPAPSSPSPAPIPVAGAPVLPSLPVIPVPRPAPPTASPAGPASAAPAGIRPPVPIPPPGDGSQVQLTLPALRGRPAEIPVLPELADRLDAGVDAAMPYLTINSVTNFAGLTIPETDLVMVLDHHIRHLLCGYLTPEECAKLRLETLEASTAAATKNPHHPSSANVAAALRRKGYLIERYRTQVGSLWQVDVGRRTWVACWLLRRSAFQETVTARWPASPRFAPVPARPSWMDPGSPEATTPAASAPPAPPAARVSRPAAAVTETPLPAIIHDEDFPDMGGPVGPDRSDADLGSDLIDPVQQEEIDDAFPHEP